MRAPRFWIVAIVLGAMPAVAAAETFLLLPGVPGDVATPDHNGWIRVATVDWTISAETSWTKGGGASVGKPNPQSIRLTLGNGPWSTALALVITTGKSFPGPVIVERVAPDGHPEFRLTMQGLFVTKYQIQSEAQKPPLDTVEAVFKAVTIEQFIVGADGKVRGSSTWSWDIPAGTASTNPALWTQPPAPPPPSGPVLAPPTMQPRPLKGG